MKVGDLVRHNWITFASRRRAKMQGCDVNAVGVIIDIAYATDPKEYTQFLVQFAGEKEPRRCTQSNLAIVE